MKGTIHHPLLSLWKGLRESVVLRLLFIGFATLLPLQSAGATSKIWRAPPSRSVPASSPSYQAPRAVPPSIAYYRAPSYRPISPVRTSSTQTYSRPVWASSQRSFVKPWVRGFGRASVSSKFKSSPSGVWVRSSRWPGESFKARRFSPPGFSQHASRRSIWNRSESSLWNRYAQSPVGY